MRDASICGLGQAAPNPVDCVIRYFPHELAAQGSGRRRGNAMNAITRAEAALVQGPTVEFELNGRKVAARAGETLLQVADREGVAIPRLCYKEGIRPRRQLPLVHGRDRRRARARTVVLPRAERRA